MNMNRLIALAIMTLVAAGAAYAVEAKDEAKHGGPAQAATPPEVKRTVDAFAGTWAVEGEVSGLPGAKGPSKAKETFVCHKAAGGRVVSCSGKGSVAGMGPVEDAALIAWDAEAKNVRFVGMSSTGELHDHTCSWKDDKTLACDPLSVTADGQPAIVDLHVQWSDAKHMSMTETTTTKDGSKVVFEGRGSR
jgi:hypothetical protein